MLRRVEFGEDGIHMGSHQAACAGHFTLSKLCAERNPELVTMQSCLLLGGNYFLVSDVFFLKVTFLRI